MENIKRKITFDEASHTYKDEHNVFYTSVTTLIGKYKEPFNRDFWAGEKAKELNIPKADILKNWDDITKFACDKGNVTHKLLEDSINESNKNANFNIEEVSFKTYYKAINIQSGCEVDIKVLGNTPLAIKYPEIFLTILGYVEQGFRIFAEKRIYWADYCVAGTIDLLLVRNKEFIIIDWKTNKDELKFKSGYYKKVNGVKSNVWVDKDTRLLSPISNIQECKGNIYTLQLSLYAKLLELWGFKCLALLLYHITDNTRPKLYNIPYWESDTQKLLIDHKNVSRKSNSSNSDMSFGIN